MKKYTDPKMNVSVFDAESIVTLSGGNVNSYEDWAQTNNASTGILEFGNAVEVDMGA